MDRRGLRAGRVGRSESTLPASLDQRDGLALRPQDHRRRDDPGTIEAPLRDGKVQAHKADPQAIDVMEKVMESEGVLLENTFQVLGSRLKPGCAEEGIVNSLVDLIQASGK